MDEQLEKIFRHHIEAMREGDVDAFVASCAQLAVVLGYRDPNIEPVTDAEVDAALYEFTTKDTAMFSRRECMRAALQAARETHNAEAT